MKTAALLTAAGMSSRMGAFKPLLPLGGSTVIGTAIAALRSAGVCEIAVVTGNEAGRLEKYLSAAGVTCLYNERYAVTDMFYSARIGLAYLQGRCGRIFFSPCDVPLFSARSLRLMGEEMDRGGCDILLPVSGGKPGHPILLASEAVPFLTGCGGEGGLKGAVDAYPGRKKILELDDTGMTLDADRPEDYERLKAYARGAMR